MTITGIPVVSTFVSRISPCSGLQRLYNSLCSSFVMYLQLEEFNTPPLTSLTEINGTPDSTYLRVVAQLPWRTNLKLIDKLDNQESRLWYETKAIENGWSSTILKLQIEACLMERTGKSTNNFSVALPPLESDMADQIFKDPYLFDFLGTDIPRREAEVEQQLIEHIQKFLLELGQGFAFVGRQVHLEVGGHDFYIDLLFYHLKLRCYVVIELKACDFELGFVSQLNMYQNAVNDIMCHPDDKPTIGLLLVKGKNKTVVEYSLAGYQNPIGVAEWKNQMVSALPEELKSSLPSIEEIKASRVYEGLYHR